MTFFIFCSILQNVLYERPKNTFNNVKYMYMLCFMQGFRLVSRIPHVLLPGALLERISIY